MFTSITLASASEIRQQILRTAGVQFHVAAAEIDEARVKYDMSVQKSDPADIALALAERKAVAVVEDDPKCLTIGCDQVLALGEKLFSKPESKSQAQTCLEALRGQTHQLLSAAVILEGTRPVWRHVGVVSLTMRDFNDSYLDSYLERNWPSIQSSVGGYKLEEEGVRLFSCIEGDYFTVLGMPLLEILLYLGERGAIEV